MKYFAAHYLQQDFLAGMGNNFTIKKTYTGYFKRHFINISFSVTLGHHRIILFIMLCQSELDALADEFRHGCLLQSGDHFQPLIGVGFYQQIY